MKKKYLLTGASLALGTALLTGCAITAVADDGSTTTVAASDVYGVVYTADEVLAANDDATTVTDDEWDPSAAVTISLNGTSASADGAGVTIDGSTVTITATGTYVLSGELKGQVIVAAPDDAVVALVLDGASISSDTTSAIAVTGADDVVVSLASGSDNSLSDTSTYADDATANAALYSAADLTITGDGSLDVSGNGNDGIASTDDLVIVSGDITVDAVDDGLRGKDSLTIAGGSLDITAGGDGLKSDNVDDATRGYIDIAGGSVAVTAGDDALDAQTDLVITDGTLDLAAESKGLVADAFLVIEGGDTTVTKSYEGIQAPSITISGGSVDLTSSDDGLNASTGTGAMGDDGSLLTIAGGDVSIDAQGDGFDSNGSAVVSGGTLTVFGPTENGNGALDVNGTLTVSGGTLLAVGSSGMAVSPGSDSPQGWISATVSGAAGDEVQIVDSAGTVVASFTAPKTYASIVYSSADLATGSTYSVLIDGTSATSVTEGVAAAGGGMGGGGGQPGGAGGPGHP
jgi:hypothetical protein